MPLSLQQKKAVVERYSSEVAQAPHVFLLSFQGISVPQVTELRNRVRAIDGQYRVIKNRLMLRAVGGSALEAHGERLTGPTAVVTGPDPVSLAKVLTEFAKESPVIGFKGGLIDGREVAGEDIQEIATLPSREELIAKLLFLLQSPISGLVRVLAALPRQFVVVLDQVRQHKEGGGAAGA